MRHQQHRLVEKQSLVGESLAHGVLVYARQTKRLNNKHSLSKGGRDDQGKNIVAQ